MTDFNFTKIQKQTSQLDCQFSAPLIKGFVVNDITELTKLEHNYPNKLVWVASEKSFYYLRDDSNYDGSQVSHWKKHGSSATITPYDRNREYLSGECVYYQKKIYAAKTNVPIGNTPPNDTYWDCIAGEITSQLISISGDTVLDIAVDNPIIQVYNNNNQMVDCCIEKTQVLSSYGYNKFKVSFESDSQTTSFSGYVIVK